MTPCALRRAFLKFLSSFAVTPVIARDFGPGAALVRYPECGVIALDEAFEKYNIAKLSIERLHTGMYWAEGPAWSGRGQCLVWCRRTSRCGTSNGPN